jgi:hypothetical protein
MRRAKLFAAALLSSAVSLPAMAADQVTFFEKDGVTYQETRRTVSRPVTELSYGQQAQTVYRERLSSGTQDVVRTYQTPVTEYQPATRMVGRWNPFVRQPYYEQRQIPVTRWETRSEVVKVPCTKRELVPETNTVQVPQYTTRMVQDEVISRVAVGVRPNTSVAAAPSTSIGGHVAGTPVPASPAPLVAGAPARATPIGGISKLDQDPPRVGDNVQWRGARR